MSTEFDNGTRRHNGKRMFFSINSIEKPGYSQVKELNSTHTLHFTHKKNAK
jgi:hypothetical protein